MVIKKTLKNKDNNNSVKISNKKTRKGGSRNSLVEKTPKFQISYDKFQEEIFMGRLKLNNKNKNDGQKNKIVNNVCFIRFISCRISEYKNEFLQGGRKLNPDELEAINSGKQKFDDDALERIENIDRLKEIKGNLVDEDDIIRFKFKSSGKKYSNYIDLTKKFFLMLLELLVTLPFKNALESENSELDREIENTLRTDNQEEIESSYLKIHQIFSDEGDTFFDNLKSESSDGRREILDYVLKNLDDKERIKYENSENFIDILLFLLGVNIVEYKVMPELQNPDIETVHTNEKTLLGGNIIDFTTGYADELSKRVIDERKHSITDFPYVDGEVDFTTNINILNTFKYLYNFLIYEDTTFDFVLGHAPKRLINFLRSEYTSLRQHFLYYLSVYSRERYDLLVKLLNSHTTQIKLRIKLNPLRLVTDVGKNKQIETFERISGYPVNKIEKTTDFKNYQEMCYNQFLKEEKICKSDIQAALGVYSVFYQGELLKEEAENILINNRKPDFISQNTLFNSFREGFEKTAKNFEPKENFKFENNDTNQTCLGFLFYTDSKVPNKINFMYKTIEDDTFIYPVVEYNLEDLKDFMNMASDDNNSNLFEVGVFNIYRRKTFFYQVNKLVNQYREFKCVNWFLVKVGTIGVLNAPGLDVSGALGFGSSAVTELGAELGAEVGAEVGAELGAEIGTEIGTEVGAEVGAEIGTDVGAEVIGDTIPPVTSDPDPMGRIFINKLIAKGGVLGTLLLTYLIEYRYRRKSNNDDNLFNQDTSKELQVTIDKGSSDSIGLTLKKTEDKKNRVVTEVDSDSPADRKKIAVGDIIIGIKAPNSDTFEDPKQKRINEIIMEENQITFKILRNTNQESDSENINTVSNEFSNELSERGRPGFMRLVGGTKVMEERAFSDLNANQGGGSLMSRLLSKEKKTRIDSLYIFESPFLPPNLQLFKLTRKYKKNRYNLYLEIEHFDYGLCRDDNCDFENSSILKSIFKNSKLSLTYILKTFSNLPCIILSKSRISYLNKEIESINSESSFLED